MEKWDIYDVNRVKTGRTMIRGELFNKNDYHVVVHVCVFNSDGKMLIQHRQFFKGNWPNKWDLSSGGSSIVGETSQDAAERETFEELGLKIDMREIRPRFTINFKNGFDDIYIIGRDVEISDLTFQKEEVQGAKWASKEEILRMIENGKFVPYKSCLIELIFNTRTELGCLSDTSS